MKSSRCSKTMLFLRLLALALLIGAAGCGGDEYTPSAATPGEPAPPSSDLSYKDLADTTVTAIDLATTVEYDADTDEVRVFAQVRDQAGNALLNLNAYNFGVQLNPGTAPKDVDAQDMQLELVTATEEVVALVIDSSGSMSAITETGETRMTVAKEAANLWVDLMAPGDLTAIVDFDDAATITQQLTTDQESLRTAINKFTASGATNLGGALTEGVKAVGTRPGKRAVILLTDGDDTVDEVLGGPEVWLSDPTSTRYQGLKLTKEQDLVVFTVGLGAGLSGTGLDDLETFATETGGEFFRAETAQDLLQAFGTTIPSKVEGLPAAETLMLSFPNTVHPPAGKELTVLLRVAASFENANGVHRSIFDGTYIVR